ncbi:hypothetical protein BDD14_2603 [Edaphobacter modestus]|uniref:Uncharacterized protein n=1 Tax=Edaphobacter modestus TaxID=388466 RepID=A0A4Q7YTM5_9BACT|nr:hypothetical protein BDD14_2603 [Edaphobacter modestus]
MRWPFKSKAATDIRIFRDPKTDAVTLRLVGPMCFPSTENSIVTLSVSLNVKLDDEGIQRLYEQLSHYAKREIGDL